MCRPDPRVLLIYLEQLRETYPIAWNQADFEKRVAVHEVGHALKINNHGNGEYDLDANGIMNFDMVWALTSKMRFVDTHLDVLRWLDKPNDYKPN